MVLLLKQHFELNVLLLVKGHMLWKVYSSVSWEVFILSVFISKTWSKLQWLWIVVSPFHVPFIKIVLSS